MRNTRGTKEDKSICVLQPCYLQYNYFKNKIWVGFRNLLQCDIGISCLWILLVNTLSFSFTGLFHFTFLGNPFHTGLQNIVYNGWILEKMFKMFPTPCGRHSPTSGPRLAMTTQAEEEGRKEGWHAARGPPHPGHHGAALPLQPVRKAASSAREGGLRPLSQALPNLTDASFHPQLRVTTVSLFSESTTLRFLGISHRNHPQDPSLRPGLPHSQQLWSFGQFLNLAETKSSSCLRSFHRLDTNDLQSLIVSLSL